MPDRSPRQWCFQRGRTTDLKALSRWCCQALWRAFPSLIARPAAAVSNSRCGPPFWHHRLRLHVAAPGQADVQLAMGDQTVNMQEYLDAVCWRLGEALRDVRPHAVVEDDGAGVSRGRAGWAGIAARDAAVGWECQVVEGFLREP
jgi:hypothetical protein